MNKILESNGLQKGDNNVELKTVKVGDKVLCYEATDPHVLWRINTLFKKEPDTLCWIDQFNSGDLFVDIGANVGMYTVYAGVVRQAKVFAFEPEAQNYALLNRNIAYNGLQEQVIAYCLALTDEVKVDRLYLSESRLGGSCHTFGASIDYNLKARESPFVQGSIAWSLDGLVADSVIPVPDHIKIDVDGLEHLVLNGAQRVVQDPQLKSILVEINTHLAEHKELIDRMLGFGYVYSQDQVDIAVRTTGIFEGTGNFIFYRPESGFDFSTLKPKRPVRIKPKITTGLVVEHLVRRCEQACVVSDPFPYFYIENLFPDEFYQQLLDNKPDNQQLMPMLQSGVTHDALCDGRLVWQLTGNENAKLTANQQKSWNTTYEALMSNEFSSALIAAFKKQLLECGVLSRRENLQLTSEVMFTRDMQEFNLGLHTAPPQCFISMTIYLPENEQYRDLGNSVARPLQRDYTCEGLTHYKVGSSDFETVYTAPYVPNSCFCFFKTNNSFQGLGPVPKNYARDCLSYRLTHKARGE